MSELESLREKYATQLANHPAEWLTLRVHYVLEAAENLIGTLEAELAAKRRLAENHRQTLLGIAKMTDPERMKQWAQDGLSGYVDTVPATIFDLQSELAAEKQKTADCLSLLRSAEADLEAARFMANGWRVQSRRVNRARHDLKKYLALSSSQPAQAQYETRTEKDRADQARQRADETAQELKQARNMLAEWVWGEEEPHEYQTLHERWYAEKQRADELEAQTNSELRRKWQLAEGRADELARALRLAVMGSWTSEGWTREDALADPAYEASVREYLRRARREEKT